MLETRADCRLIHHPPSTLRDPYDALKLDPEDHADCRRWASTVVWHPRLCGTATPPTVRHLRDSDTHGVAAHGVAAHGVAAIADALPVPLPDTWLPYWHEGTVWWLCDHLSQWRPLTAGTLRDLLDAGLTVERPRGSPIGD